jgi:rhodanese-related sulfurtransferase
MNEFISFAQNHLFMLSIWIVLFITVIIVELLNKKKRPLQISSQILVELINEQKAKVIDIRTTQNFKQGHILNSKNIPWLGQDEKAFKPFQNETIVLICQQGQEATKLADKLQSQGFEQIKVLEGGISSWRNNNLPLVKGK